LCYTLADMRSAIAVEGQATERAERRLMTILRALADRGRPLGAVRLGHELERQGTELSARTVRYYLAVMDQRGWTENLGRRGRRITPEGEQELESAFVAEKVGFVAARVDALSYRMSFRLGRPQGSIIVNVSTVAPEQVGDAARAMIPVFAAGLGMGRYIVAAPPGTALGEFRVPEGRFALGTVCSVAINGVFLSHGIATVSKFGGLLELEGGQPKRFTQIIYYEGTTLDPLEIFIKGHMTSVQEAVRTGRGTIGASFREVPAEATQEVNRIAKRLERAGLGAIMLIGRPSQPLLGLPVTPGRTGLIVAGGLNPLAAVEESGISTQNHAMGSLFPFEKLQPYEVLAQWAKG